MIIIETKRLCIKQIESEDISQLLRIYNSSKNMQFISDGKCKWSKDEIINKYEKINKNYALGFGIFVIKKKKTNEIVGEAGLFNSFSEASKLELGYIIDNKHWLKGYGKETCAGLIDYAFNTLNVTVLIARMYAKNVSSVVLSEKCGMIKINSGTSPEGEEYFIYELKKK